MSKALLLFAKVPRPGDVKTRLTPVLTSFEAARLYRAFLLDTVRQVRRLDADVRLYFAPPLPDGPLEEIPSNVSVHEQQGASLGPRMKQALRETLEAGCERVLVMGSDHPTLPTSFLRRAFRALQVPRSLCLGPTEDGGFYLVGMNAFYPQLFEGVSYGHSEVFSDTLARVEQTDAQLTILPPWYDVDTPKDLDRLRIDLEEGEADVPNTRRITEELGLERGS